MIDQKDKKILYYLYWDCRLTNSKLGKKIKVSKQVVAYRINQLEKKGFIKSYHALIDWRRLGYTSLRIYLRWRSISPDKEEEIYEYLKKDSLFMWSVKFEGEIDIAFYVWVKSIPDFSTKWFNFLDKYGEYILKQEIYASVTMVHYQLKPLIKDYSEAQKVIGEKDIVDYDSIDYNILKCLTENAKIPIIAISKKLNLAPKSIIRRKRKLEEKGIILGYQAFVDTDKLGYQFYKLDFFLRSHSRIKEMFEYAKHHKNIVYRMRTIGGPDFEIELMVKSVLEMREILDALRSRFHAVIDYYRIHRLEYTIKRIYLPGDYS